MKITKMKVVLAGMLFSLMVSFTVAAQEFVSASEGDGMWYSPNHPGHGIVLNYNYSTDVAALTWFLHRPDLSSAFLSGGQLCEFFPCVVELVEPSASLLGGHGALVGGYFELGPPVGMASLTLLNDNEMRVEYIFIPWLNMNTPEYCENISGAGYLYRGCVGTITLNRLTKATP